MNSKAAKGMVLHLLLWGFLYRKNTVLFSTLTILLGDGDSEDIGGKVLDGVRAISHGLGVDVPGYVPDLGADLV